MSSCRVTSLAWVALALMVCVSVDLSEALPKRKHHQQSMAPFDSNEAIDSSSKVFERHQRTPVDSAKAKSKRPAHLRIRNAPAAEVILPASSSQVLECEAGGNPPPMIHWLKDGKRISQSLEEVLGLESSEDDSSPQGILGLSFTRSRLYLDCAQAQDAAQYTCVAENPFTRVSANTDLKVLSSKQEGENDNSVALCLTKKSYGSPARIHMWTRTRLEMIGSEVRLFCRASGSPSPTISWIGPDEAPITSSDKFNVMDNGDLVIKELAWSDMGGFTCLASNANGDDRSITFLYPTMPEKK